MSFTELADGVFVLRYPAFDVNCSLVVGASGALLVDTLSTPEQAAELHAAIKHITTLPLTVVNTHFHFDHCFGNETLDPSAIWGHPDCASELREHGTTWLERWQREYDIDLSHVTIRAPDHLVRTSQTLDLGGRSVTVSHPGRGHTSGDVVVHAGDVLIAGDLVEESGPPSFEDSYPLDWPDTLAALIESCGPEAIVVPGHGAVCDVAFLREQHDQLTRLDWLIREGHADGAPVDRIAAAAPYNSEIAVRRGFAQLTGELAV